MLERSKKTQLLQRRILSRVFIGTTILALIVATLSGLPLVSQLKHSKIGELKHNLELKASSIESYIRIVELVANQISSRARAKGFVVQYRDGKISKETVRKELNVILKDAFQTNQSILGITRVSLDGTILASVGKAPSPTMDLTHFEKLTSVQFLGFHKKRTSQKTVSVVAPILDGIGEPLGVDIVLFSTAELDTLLQPSKEAKTLKFFLVDHSLEKPRLYSVVDIQSHFPNIDNIAKLISKMNLRKDEVMEYSEKTANPSFIAKYPLPHSTWEVVGVQHEDELLASARKTQITVTILAAILALGSALGIYSWIWPQFQEITSREDLLQERENVLELEHHFQAILDGCNSPIFAKDLKGRYLFANKSCLQVFGKPISEVVGKLDEDLLPAEVAQQVKMNDDLVKSKKTPLPAEEIIPLKDGVVRTYLSVKYPLFDKDGILYGIGGVATDITAQKHDHALIQTQKEFLDAILENIPNMVFVKEAKELRFVRFNKAGEELLGVPRETLMGKNDFDFFPKNEAEFFIKKDREVLQNGNVLDIPEEPIHTTTNGVRYLHTRKVPVKVNNDNSQAEYLLGISEDITERKTYEKKLSQLNVELDASLKEQTAELKHSNEELEKFAYIASHDLQAPLRHISSYTELLVSKYSSVADPQVREWKEFIIQGCQQMKELINDLLDYSRIGKSDQETMSSTNLTKVFEDVKATLKQDLEKSQAILRVDPLPTLMVNPIQFKQLFQNLIGNALKFQKPNTKPEITLSVIDRVNHWEFSVRDNGIGIDKKYQDQIFQPFKRLHSSNLYSGTGIGLSICQKIVKHHGGRIWVDSNLGEGCTFTFTIPKTKQNRIHSSEGCNAAAA